LRDPCRWPLPTLELVRASAERGVWRLRRWGGDARRDAVGARRRLLFVICCSGCAWTAQNTKLPCTACPAWQRASAGRVAFGRVGPLSRRLHSEQGERFQVVPSAELSSAGHLGRFELGFGLVAKPAHPPGPPLGGAGASGRRKKKWSQTRLSFNKGHQ